MAIVRRDELGLCGRLAARGLQRPRTIGRHLPVAEPHRLVVPLKLAAFVRAGHGTASQRAGVSALAFVRAEAGGRLGVPPCSGNLGSPWASSLEEARVARGRAHRRVGRFALRTNALLAAALSQPAHREPTGASASLLESFKLESTRGSGALRATGSCFSRETLSGCLSEVGRARRENGGGRALLP